jgi:hypothetical protein
MYLHYILEYDCELKSHGLDAFVRAMTTYALVRDLEGGRAIFDRQPDPDEFANAMKSHEWEPHYLYLPLPARRSKDPMSGLLAADTAMPRVEKIVEKGEICEECPMCHTNPKRFGCWGTLSLPIDLAVSAWLHQRWKEGTQGKKKARLARWYQDDAEWDASKHQLYSDPGNRDSSASHELNLDGLVFALSKKQELNYKDLSELLTDFGAIDWDAMKRLFTSLREHEQASAPKPDHPSRGVGPIPFLLQPEKGDHPQLLEWKSFLYACYCALHHPTPIKLQIIDDPEE